MIENDESMDAPKSVLFHWKYNNYEKDVKSWNPWTLQNLSISSIGNTTIMKKAKSMNRWTLHNLSISLGNMKILKISRSNQKSASPSIFINNLCFFEEKTMLGLQYKNQPVQECLYLLACLKDVDDNNGRREMT